MADGRGLLAHCRCYQPLAISYQLTSGPSLRSDRIGAGGSNNRFSFVSWYLGGSIGGLGGKNLAYLLRIDLTKVAGED